jgi:hypothetical protein
MDITYWLNDSKDENTEKWNQQHLIKLLSEKQKDNMFDLREYSYLIQTIKQNNTLINSKLFSDLIQKTNSDEIKKQLNILYPTIYDENGLPDLDKIVSNFIEIKKQHNFNPTVDQYTAIVKLINFISDYNKFMFGLYGYAGTGKTTIMSEIIHYLLSTKLITSVAFTAPTNKAVDVCKTKFMNSINELHQKLINDKKMNDTKNTNDDKIINKEIEQIKTFDEMLEDLNNCGIKIDFITIHRLLNYKTDFDISGDKMFIKQSKNLLGDYQLIIIDECSMIQLELVSNIFDEVYHDINSVSKPKIIFSGDTAQLPPVNELNSSIFIKKQSDITEKDFIRAFPLETQERFVLDIENVKNKIDLLTKRILTIECVILKQIVRNNNENVNKLCHEIRKWIDKEIKVPEFGKYVDKEFVYAYKKPMDKGKTESKWFKTFITELQKGNNNIILAWTNKHCDMYNMTARKIIFKDKEIINEYESGDILIFSEFHNLEMKDKCERFHTSEQIYVHYVEPDIYMRPVINCELSKTAMKMKNIIHIEQIYKKTVNQLNKVISERYLIWKLYVYRLSDIKQKDKIPENYILKVIQSSSLNLWNANKNICVELIKKLRQTLKNDFKTQINNIDTHIIKPLWKELNRVIIDPFANVNYGFAITTHKSQGSTYYNIFVDIDDILDNKNDNEAKRCLYTSLTRSSNKIHILL